MNENQRKAAFTYGFMVVTYIIINKLFSVFGNSQNFFSRLLFVGREVFSCKNSGKWNDEEIGRGFFSSLLFSRTHIQKLNFSKNFIQSCVSRNTFNNLNRVETFFLEHFFTLCKKNNNKRIF